MSSARKPRLLFLRFSRSDLPAFIRLHLQEQVLCLSQFFDVTVINHPCDYGQLCDKYEPDISMFESGVYVGQRDVTNVSAHPHIPKLGFIHCDAYCRTREIAISDMARWDITTYFTISVSLGSYTPAIADNLFVWPNFANPDIHRDYNLPKVIPVLFTGSRAIHYPWRNRVNSVISQHYPSLQCPHFGWFGADTNRPTSRMMYGREYARLINASWVAPTCGTVANDVVRKHFEIPACNTGLITQRTPAIESAGFSDLVNCVFADDVDVLEKLDYLFQRRDELDRITLAGRQLVESRHTMQHRDQIFQWYTLHKHLKPGQKIVQLGAFLPLTIVPQSAQISNSHVMSNGVDRLLLVQGDEKLWSARYDEAEILYRQCLNYHHMPEPNLRLALCCLYKGNPRGAIDILSTHIDWALTGYKEVEPDPVEWAYFIVALLCQGKYQQALFHANQFSTLHHEELERVRTVTRLLSDGATEVSGDQGHGSYRASVHELPKRTMDGWTTELGKMLSACKQTKAAETLGRAAVRLTAVERTESAHGGVPRGMSRPIGDARDRDGAYGKKRTTAHQDVSTVNVLSYRMMARAWLRRHIKPVALQSLRKLESHLGHFLPYKWSTMSLAKESVAIQGLLRGENIRLGLLIGAAAHSWLTEAFLAGMDENPNLPLGIVVNYSTPRFMKLKKRLDGKARVQCRFISGENIWFDEKRDFCDAVAIDCSELDRELGRFKMPCAGLIILDDINIGLGYDLFRLMLADRNYVLHSHEPSQRNGYSIFRRVGTCQQHEALAVEPDGGAR